MSLLFSTGLMKWRLCIAIAEPQQSYPAAKKRRHNSAHMHVRNGCICVASRSCTRAHGVGCCMVLNSVLCKNIIQHVCIIMGDS